MKMLLHNVTRNGLANILRRHAERSSIPYLLDSRAVSRARKLAVKNGIWSDLCKLDPSRPIPALKRSDYRMYQRAGDRVPSQERSAERRNELERAALALWLDHPNAGVDYLQDLLWAYCEDWTWVMAAHEGLCDIDLGSAELGLALSEILCLLEDRIEGEVRDRVERAIHRNVLEPFHDARLNHWWKTAGMNWNTVCNGSIVQTALCLVSDAGALARIVHEAIRNMTFAINGYADDGGCREGPGYWEYGFGHFLYAAHALYLKTDGELNIMKDDSGKIERVCRYPLAADISAPFRARFGDAFDGYVSARTALTMNQYHPVPEIYALCEQHPDRTLKVNSLHELAMYSGFKVKAGADSWDVVLPSLGMAKLRGGRGRRMTLMCIAGNNGVPHGHNDVGSFMVHKEGRMVLDDPGLPLYTGETFGPNRFKILFCGSLGHSVPVINGEQQKDGAEFAGTLQVGNLNGRGVKKAVIDMTGAYPKGAALKLERSFILDGDSNILILEDVFEFKRKPRSLEEAFVTYEDARVAGKSVLIGPKSRGATLSLESGAGRFKAVRMEKESEEGLGGRLLARIPYLTPYRPIVFPPVPPTGRVLTRISFQPRSLERRMVLRFRIG